MDERILGKIVEFFYTSVIEINEDNVQELLSIASLLQVQSVLDASCEFLRRQLTDENCLGKLATFHHTPNFNVQCNA